MNPLVLDSCRDFYQRCRRTEFIPVETTKGKFYHSTKEEHFQTYLDQFSESDRKYITGDILPKKNLGKSVMSLFKSLSTTDAKKVLKILEDNHEGR